MVCGIRFYSDCRNKKPCRFYLYFRFCDNIKIKKGEKMNSKTIYALRLF